MQIDTDADDINHTKTLFYLNNGLEYFNKAFPFDF